MIRQNVGSAGATSRLPWIIATVAVAALCVGTAHAEVPLSFKVIPSDGAANDGFGGTVSLDGDTLLVGSAANDSNGAAYVYDRNLGGAENWGEVKKLTASDGAVNDRFGTSVDLSGDIGLVGAILSTSATEKGAAYLFSRNLGGSDNWGELKKLTASDGAIHDQYGAAVTVDGTTAIVGAFNQGNSGLPGVFDGTGAAYVYYKDSGGADNWGEVKKITAATPEGESRFGRSLSLHGDSVVIGAPNENTSASDSGSVFVFDRNEGGADNWGQVKEIIPADIAGRDSYGASVDIYGDRIIVGSLADDDLGSASGSAYIFERNEGGANNWGQVKKLLASDGAAGDSFGRSVALFGDYALVGSVGDGGAPDPAPESSGAAYLYYRNEGGPGAWGEVGKFVASERVLLDFFGASVAVQGNTIVVGASRDDGHGSAYIRTIPEPSSVVLAALGLLGTLAYLRRKV
jgi:hypothetical protein